jgi:hypothetical protein
VRFSFTHYKIVIFMKQILLTLIFLSVITFPICSFAQDAEEQEKIDKNIITEYLKVQKTETVNDIWAKALWVSLPSQEFDSEDAEKLLKTCLKMTKNKAPIYVALGDIGSGSIKLTEAFNKAVLNALTKKPEIALDGIDKDLEENENSSVLYYCAAVSEKPDYIIGWFKIAKHAEGELQIIAIDKLISLDPKNALPYYMKAAYIIEKEGVESAIKFIEQGNKKEYCHFYQSEVPKNFSLVFNEEKYIKENNLVGKPITYTFLANMISKVNDSYSWMDPLEPDLRNIWYITSDTMDKIIKNGETKTAIHNYKTLQTMGIKILLSNPFFLNNVILGESFNWGSQRKLEKIYQSAEMNEELESIKQSLEALKSSQNKISTLIDELSKLTEKRKDIYLGKIDLIQIEHDKLEQVLIEKGYLKKKEKE